MRDINNRLNSHFRFSIAAARSSRLLDALSSLKNDKKGVAAVEFAMVVPLILLLLLGSVGLFDLYNGSRSIERGAATVVDLVSRQSEMEDDKFDLLIATSESLIGRYAEGAGFELVVSSIENVFDSDDDPTLTVAWSKSNVESKEIEDSDLVDYELPAVPEGGSIILVSVRNSYTPYVTTDAVGLVEFERNSVRRPRFVESVEYIVPE